MLLPSLGYSVAPLIDVAVGPSAGWHTMNRNSADTTRIVAPPVLSIGFKVSQLTQQRRFHITRLWVSYQWANPTLTKAQIADWISQSNLTISPILLIRRRRDLTLV